MSIHIWCTVLLMFKIIYDTAVHSNTATAQGHKYCLISRYMYAFKTVTDCTWGSTGDMIYIAISLLYSELVKLVSMFVP